MTPNSKKKPASARRTPARDGLSVLGYSLLSLLARKDRTGYELSRFTTGARSMILSASGHSNIYKELAKLRTRKYVTFRVIKDARPFDKKLYSLTALGRDTLVAWVTTGPEPFASRRETTVRTHALWLLKPKDAIALLDKQIALARDEVRELEAHSAYLQSDNDVAFPPSARHPLFGTYSNIVLESQTRELMIRWCETMKRHYAGADAKAPARSKRG